MWAIELTWYKETISLFLNKYHLGKKTCVFWVFEWQEERPAAEGQSYEEWEKGRQRDRFLSDEWVTVPLKFIREVDIEPFDYDLDISLEVNPHLCLFWICDSVVRIVSIPVFASVINMFIKHVNIKWLQCHSKPLDVSNLPFNHSWACRRKCLYQSGT